MKHFFFIWTTFLLLTVSCGQQNEQEKKVLKGKQDSSQTTVLHSDTQATIQQTIFHFDTLLFKRSMDSLIKSIYSNHIRTTLQIDTIKKQGEFNMYPFIDSARWTIKYRFRPKPSGHLSVTIYESQFADTSTADRLLRITRAFGEPSSENQISTNRAPAGLSYGFDFVFRYKDKIFALNSPCTYSDKNYDKLLDNFKKSFETTIPSDCITCRCGNWCK